LSRSGTDKRKKSEELVLAYKELSFQKKAKEKHAADLIIANKELVYQNDQKEKCAAELVIANKELVYQNDEKEKRAEELIISTTLDITERKKDEEYFWHLAAIVESSDDAIISKSLDGTIKSWNKGSERMFGYSATEAIGKHISLIIPPEYINDEKEIIERILNNEIITHFDTVRNRKNGEQFFVSLTVSPLKDRAGNIIGVSKITRDTTSSKRSEGKLIRVNRELAFQNDEKEKRAAELIIANKELIFQNEEKEKRAAELIIANKELAFQNEEKEKRAAELIIANKELAFQNEEKEKRAAELIVANKELAFQNDEKEKRAAELIIANKELTFQNEEKEKRAAELMIANKELEQFSYIASHDLQEPLRTVSNYIQVFEEDYLEQLDANARKYLHSVNNAIQRMKFLIKALLDFSLLGQNTKLIKVDFKKLIYDVMADLDTMIKTSNAAIEVTEMPQLNVYEIEMRQLFQNLISNAIKFAKKHTQPEIRISSEKINGKWKFSVSDKGIGIAPEHFERVFDIFQRLPTDENHGGNGIGLANCKKIVQLHQGEIWVESNQAQGTIFHFTIPSLKI